MGVHLFVSSCRARDKQCSDAGDGLERFRDKIEQQQFRSIHWKLFTFSPSNSIIWNCVNDRNGTWVNGCVLCERDGCVGLAIRENAMQKIYAGPYNGFQEINSYIQRRKRTLLQWASVPDIQPN